MFEAKTIPAEHKDLIHDVAYDYHGRRMATCSSDQYVKIWDQENGEWKCTSSWKSHFGSVWRVTWAHPEFGQVIATCSFDRTAIVWEELPSGEGGEAGQTHWVKRSSLVDSRTSVTDVKFAPKHLGLQLATCSADGIVRIYEAPDVMSLSGWTLAYEINVKLSCSCISWNPSRVHTPMITVGSDDPNPSGGAKVQIYEFNEAARKWFKVEAISLITESVRDVAFAPNMGRSYHLLAIAAKDVTIVTLRPLRNEVAPVTPGGAVATKFEVALVAQFKEHQSQVWRLSWNLTGTILASTGDDGCVRLWKGNYLDNWKRIGEIRGDGSASQGEKTQTSGSYGSAASAGSAGARYYKMGALQPTGQQVAWH